MPNFSIALTGLQADTVALNTIGNNLANLNTTAFKTQSTSFSDLFYQNIGSSGSGDALQVGVGTQVSGTATDYSQGTLATTTRSTDMALSGNGFFLVDNGGTQALTRTGDFQMDSSGKLITSSGESVMGYGVANGAVNLNGGLVPLQLPVSEQEPAQATHNVSLTTSLNASSPTGTQFSSPVTLYDSLGTSQAATVTYTKTGAATWGYSVALPAGSATGTPVNNTGTLTFDSSGVLVTPAANVAGVSFPGMADGASNLTFNFNLYSATGGALVSQTSGTSNTTVSSQDGFAAGSYQGFTVGTDGTLSASFSNGQTAAVGQVAVATVVNEAGLARAGANDFVTTDASGAISAGLANVGGRATLEGDSLEQSNVDISAEFSDLIVAQRAFEANSKTVTTFDSVTQDAIGMIR
jgi:flagellar hook protein FlgE